MHGLHLTADLYQCACADNWLIDSSQLTEHITKLIQKSNLALVGQAQHTFCDEKNQPNGVTLAFLLAESHICLHTWPQLKQISLDIYVCNYLTNNADKAKMLLHSLTDLFQAQQCIVHETLRGQIP